jgi:hypothetical protein
VTDIEIIKADLKSIYDAQRCLESMRSLQGDRELTMGFSIIWGDLNFLATQLQRKLAKIKNKEVYDE